MGRAFPSSLGLGMGWRAHRQERKADGVCRTPKKVEGEAAAQREEGTGMEAGAEAERGKGGVGIPLPDILLERPGRRANRRVRRELRRPILSEESV